MNRSRKSEVRSQEEDPISAPLASDVDLHLTSARHMAEEGDWPAVARIAESLARLAADYAGAEPAPVARDSIPQDYTMTVAQEFCERTINDLNRGRATLRYETFEAFERLCTQCGISTIQILS